MRVHPFVCFDPLRQLNEVKTGSIRTAFDLIKLAVTDYGFIGVKVYPPMGWRPTGNMARPGLTQADADTLNAIVSDLAAWCEQEDVPLTAHCNNSNYASPDYVGMGQPDEWARLLKDYPGLHLNLGHCGGAHQNVADYVWPDAIRKAMTTYTQLYGDVGCDRIDDAATGAAYAKYLTDAAAQDPTIESRLMFGTDWYLEALNPNANQFLTEATNIATAAFTGPTRQPISGGDPHCGSSLPLPKKKTPYGCSRGTTSSRRQCRDGSLTQQRPALHSQPRRAAELRSQTPWLRKRQTDRQSSNVHRSGIAACAGRLDAHAP